MSGTYVGGAVGDAVREAGEAPGAPRVEEHGSPGRAEGAAGEETRGAGTSPPRDAEEAHRAGPPKVGGLGLIAGMTTLSCAGHSPSYTDTADGKRRAGRGEVRRWLRGGRRGGKLGLGRGMPIVGEATGRDYRGGALAGPRAGEWVHVSAGARRWLPGGTVPRRRRPRARCLWGKCGEEMRGCVCAVVSSTRLFGRLAVHVCIPL